MNQVIQISPVSCPNFLNIGQLRSQIFLLQDLYRLYDQPLHHFTPSLQTQNRASLSPYIVSSLTLSSTQSDPPKSCSPSIVSDDYRKGTKNVVKNIVKAFQVWIRLKLGQDSEDLNLQLKQNLAVDKRYYLGSAQLYRFLDKFKFNRQLILSMVNHPDVRAIFEEFLITDAHKWLSESKIKDRRSHAQAIQVYTISCSTGRVPKFQSLKIQDNK